MLCLVLLLLFLGTMIGAVFVVLTLTKNTDVDSGGEITASVPDTSQTAVVETTASRSTNSMDQLLDYDTTTDQWLISDDSLRGFDQVSFKTSSGAFYHLDLAEIIRVDS